MTRFTLLPPLAILLSGACQSGPSPSFNDGAAERAGDDMAAPSTEPSTTNGCCEAHAGAGCGDPALEACVCELRPECCSERWDETCVRLLDEKHCEPGVRECLCGDWQQSQCCEGVWDTFCRITAEEKCAARPSCNTEPVAAPPATKGSCCAVGSGGGCADPEIEACVCGLLPDCCTRTWDAVCVQLVVEKHCQPGVRTCLCEDWEQGACCETRWTDFCEMTAELKCGATLDCG
jgi:hypothetical protein